MSAITKESGGWMPVRRGDEFCSPNCGFGCTHAAYEQATREARALAERLGGDWKPRVWENTGWRYEVGLGVCRITVTLKGGGAISGGWVVAGYTAWINTSPQFISEIRETPEEAFREALGLMQEVFDQLSDSVKGMHRINLQMGGLIEEKTA